MTEELDNPLAEAVEKYNTLHSYATNLAEAAAQHPEIPYEQLKTPKLSSETEIIDREESELNADIAIYTALISRELQETDELFYFELGRELDEYLRQKDETLFEGAWSAHDHLQESYDDLKESIQIIDNSLERHPAAYSMTDPEKPEELEPVNSTLQSASD
jgi:hypothetical protein